MNRLGRTAALSFGAGAAAEVNGTFLRALKWVAGRIPLSRQSAFVRFVLPRRFWYAAALRIASLQGAMVQWMGGNGAFTRALMLDFWLRELSHGGAFPIPFEIEGADVVRSSEPKMYTWTHLPLTEVPLRVGLEAGGAEPAVVSDLGKVVGENQFLVFGWPKRIEAIPVDSQLLGRVRSTLRGGKSVVFLADEYLGGPLSEVPLRIAARLRVPLVFQWAELEPNGRLRVTFRLAPHPYSEDEAAIEANLQFLREQNRAVLERLGWMAPQHQ